jgi:hypothetical protein
MTWLPTYPSGDPVAVGMDAGPAAGRDLQPLP